MPTLKMGSKATFEQGGVFVHLKAKKEQVHLRIVKDPTYTGKHFAEEANGKWKVTDCPRIMDEAHCDTCEEYFTIIAPLKALKKQMKDLSDDLEKAKIQVQVDKILAKARPYKPTVAFFYAIIDREEHKAKIFQTTLSIRLKIDEELNSGIDVTKYDYKVTRTEKPGNDYYTLVRMPDAVPLTEDEQKEFEKAKDWDLEDMVGGKKSDQLEETTTPEASVEEKVEEPAEDETPKTNPDDIPF